MFHNFGVQPGAYDIGSACRDGAVNLFAGQHRARSQNHIREFAVYAANRFLRSCGAKCDFRYRQAAVAERPAERYRIIRAFHFDDRHDSGHGEFFDHIQEESSLSFSKTNPGNESPESTQQMWKRFH